MTRLSYAPKTTPKPLHRRFQSHDVFSTNRRFSPPQIKISSSSVLSSASSESYMSSSASHFSSQRVVLDAESPVAGRFVRSPNISRISISSSTASTTNGFCFNEDPLDYNLRPYEDPI